MAVMIPSVISPDVKSDAEKRIFPRKTRQAACGGIIQLGEGPFQDCFAILLKMVYNILKHTSIILC